MLCSIRLLSGWCVVDSKRSTLSSPFADFNCLISFLGSPCRARIQKPNSSHLISTTSTIPRALPSTFHSSSPADLCCSLVIRHRLCRRRCSSIRTSCAISRSSMAVTTVRSYSGFFFWLPLLSFYRFFYATSPLAACVSAYIQYQSFVFADQ